MFHEQNSGSPSPPLTLSDTVMLQGQQSEETTTAFLFNKLVRLSIIIHAKTDLWNFKTQLTFTFLLPSIIITSQTTTETDKVDGNPPLIAHECGLLTVIGGSKRRNRWLCLELQSLRAVSIERSGGTWGVISPLPVRIPFTRVPALVLWAPATSRFFDSEILSTMLRNLPPISPSSCPLYSCLSSPFFLGPAPLSVSLQWKAHKLYMLCSSVTLSVEAYPPLSLQIALCRQGTK